MIDVNTEIMLEVSKGQEQTDPPETTVAKVTKDVVIDLRNSAATAACQVTVTRDGKVVYSGTVAQGAESITIKNESGSGMVYYEVMINNSEGWIQKEIF